MKYAKTMIQKLQGIKMKKKDNRTSPLKAKSSTTGSNQSSSLDTPKKCAPPSKEFSTSKREPMKKSYMFWISVVEGGRISKSGHLLGLSIWWQQISAKKVFRSMKTDGASSRSISCTLWLQTLQRDNSTIKSPILSTILCLLNCAFITCSKPKAMLKMVWLQSCQIC